MSEFKSGEDVLFYGSEYVYIAKHPIFPDFSVIQAKGDLVILGDLIYTNTGQIKKKPKTHTVNGFEVPAPVSKDEFRDLEDNTYCFSPTELNGYVVLNKFKTEVVAVKCGFVFKTEYDVKKNIAALQGIDPSTVE